MFRDFKLKKKGGRQGGKSIQSGGSAIVNRGRIWKLEKNLYRDVGIHLFEECISVDNIEMKYDPEFFCVFGRWMMERCFEG